MGRNEKNATELIQTWKVKVVIFKSNFSNFQLITVGTDVNFVQS
jgi:hypothetical protein